MREKERRGREEEELAHTACLSQLCRSCRPAGIQDLQEEARDSQKDVTSGVTFREQPHSGAGCVEPAAETPPYFLDSPGLSRSPVGRTPSQPGSLWSWGPALTTQQLRQPHQGLP